MSKTLTLSLWSTLALAVALLYYFHFSSPEIVYVDARRLVNNYQGMIDAREEFKKKTALWQANRDTLAKDVETRVKDFQQNQPGMSKKEKELAEELIRTKQKQLNDYLNATDNMAQQEDSEMTANVLAQVNNYLQEYGQQNNYRIILAATEYGNVAYAAKGLDITDDILEKLNDQYNGL
ncbi:MAG: OmpH family outer membrane protein [Cytophagales bacterium]|nr:OmpH family outer membrane protein [Cytophagales bacterium]